MLRRTKYFSPGRAVGCCLALSLFLTVGCQAGKQTAAQARVSPMTTVAPVNHGCEEHGSTLASLREVGGEMIPLERNRFALAWFPRDWGNRATRRLVVSLHGSGGCAERMFTFWHRNTPIHDFAFLAVQYAETDPDGELHFDSSPQVYDLLLQALDQVEKRYSLAHVPVILHGFSKGSAMVFELAAIDRGQGGAGRFSAFIADSGAVFPEYRGGLSPALRNLGPGAYVGARFWLYCGTADHGGRTCLGVERMDNFVRHYGGQVDAVYRYQGGGHGIFLTGGPHRHSDALEALFGYINALPAP